MSIPPLAILMIGIVTVIGMILVLRLNAFLALITAAILVALLTPTESLTRFTDAQVAQGTMEPGQARKLQQMTAPERAASAFGESAGNIGIVIALAAIIGTCMMDSGAADRIVRAFLRLLGEKQAPVALMGSGFVLGIPVFFDTVFYLLIPLGRSLYRSTRKHYLKYILAIGCGGAVTHTLVPPTPGPLLMADLLGVDIGLMIVVGLAVALPAAMAGLAFSGLIDRLLPVPMRPVGGTEESTAVVEGSPPPDGNNPALVEFASDRAKLPPLWASILPVALPVILISVNTALKSAVEAAGEDVSESLRQAASAAALFGNANLALLLSAAVAMILYVVQRRPSREQFAQMVEASLMSGGVIILITSAGGAFGATLKQANIGEAIEAMFRSEQGTTGMTMMLLGFGVSAVLKIAQGSSTVAMITASGMLAGMVVSPGMLGYNPVYLATAIGSGSLIGSWMNDSGFWIVAKMSGLTEVETLKSWTPMLIVLGTVGLLASMLLANLVPLV